jgi:type IV pilus assembly protein PilY1
VATLGDAKVEDDEDFSVLISSLHVAYDGNDASGTGTIANDDQFGITVNNSSATEGSPVTFTVTLGTETAIALDVTFDASDGTATVADSDYTDAPGSVTFAAGSLAGATRTFTVATTGDTKVEDDEDFSVLVSSLHVAYDGNDAGGTGTIANDDQFGITVNNSSAVEGSPVTFTVTLNNETDIDLAVTYDASDGSAMVADNDYTDAPGTVTFAAGSLAGATQTFTVATTGDAKVEDDEDFSVLVSSLHVAYDSSDATGTGTITNDDQFNVTVNNSSAIEGTAVTFIVTLNTDSDVFIDVTYDASDGTATVADGDYTDAPGFVSFPAGSVAGVTQTFTVATTGDAKVEDDEDFSVLISSLHPYYDGNDASGSGTIVNDDQFGITVNNGSAVEGSPVTFTVTLNAETAIPLGVTFDASDGTATVLDSDYTDAPGSVTFAAGSLAGATRSFTVATTGDAKVEADEDFSVLVSSLHTAYDGNDASGTGTITNDDQFGITVNNSSAPEGTAVTFEVTLGVDSEIPLTVTYDASDGTATVADNDYMDLPGSVTFPANSLTGDKVSFSVSTTSDLKIENDETFDVTVSSADGNFDGTDASGTGTIANDDLFGITVANSSAVEGDPVTFTVTLNAETAVDLNVTYDASDGSATVADNDYTDAPGSVTFAAGSLAGAIQTFSVATIADLNLEPDEDFAATVSSGHIAFDGNDATGTGTISNNDHEITFTAGPNGQLDVGGILYSTYTEVVETGDTTSTVDPVPDAGYNFLYWDGVPPAWVGVDPLAYGPVTGPMFITANFLIPPVITPIGHKGGDLSPWAPVMITSFPNSTTFTVTPNAGWCIEDVLVNGVSQGIITSYTFTDVSTDQTIEALFREQWKIIGDIEPYTARSLYGGAGRWRAYDTATGGTVFDTGWMEHLQSATVPSCGTTNLTVEFEPQAGWQEPAPQNVTISEDTTVAGWYKPQLTVVTSNGTVTSTQPGIDCGADCTEYYDFNTMVELTALPGAGYIFKEFLGEVSTNMSPTVVMMDKPLTVTATYEVQTATNVDNDLDGWSIDDGDCNDGNDQIRPGADEQCDATDWDCDGMTSLSSPIDPDCISTSLADIPLDTQLQAAPANIMFILDDSGSMDWTFIIKGNSEGTFEGKRYVFDDPGDNRYGGTWRTLNDDQRAKWRSQWYGFNRMYYNPNVEYKPWPNGDGTRFPDADLDNPRSNPESSSYTLDMDDDYLVDYLGADGYANDCASATPIRGGTTYTAKIETPGTYDFYAVNISNGGQITAFTAGSTDTYGYMYDEFCNLIEEDDDDGSSNNWRIQRNVSAGVYIFGVRHYDEGYGTGDYQFRVNLTGGATSSCPAAFDIDGNSCTPPGPATITINPTIINAHYYVKLPVDNDGDGEWDLDAVGNPVVDTTGTQTNTLYLVMLDDPSQIKYYRVTDDSGVLQSLTLLDPVADAAEIALIKPPLRERATYADEANPTAAEMRQAERQNFVNWYSFYRRRELTAKAAVGEVVDGLKGLQVGYFSLNHRLIQQVLKVRVTEQDANGDDVYIDYTASLLHQLYGLDSSGGTPLRRALRDVGRYFDADDGDDGGVGPAPWYSDASGECQQSFAIVMTDGYYNGGNPGVSNAEGDGSEAGTTDTDGDEMYYDTYSETLADVAMKYYKNDLEDSLANRVPTNFIDDAEYQHMVTYSVSFGVFGSLNPDDYDLYNSNTALRDYPVWPNPSGSYIRKIDDMWHAAVNGRGLFLSADNPATLVNSLQEVMLNLTSRIGSGASLTVNGEELHAGTTVFQGKYSTDGWVGDVQAFNVNQVSGEVITGDGNAIWSASEELGEGSDWNDVNWDTDREIATFDPASEQGIPFRWTGATTITAQQKGWLSDNPLTGAIDDDGKGELRLQYLRGENSNEVSKGGVFRTRYSKLGDIVHSSPLYSGYGTYGVVYAGANDGMLHAFHADTGQELFAYVPNLSFQYLNQLPLAEPDFKHRFYVDQTPFVKDTGSGADDHGRLLVGGLGKGGKGYYCLDVTTPLLNDESNAASWVNWEYPNPNSATYATEAANMGFSYSQVFVVKSYATGHKWVVLFGNGYSSDSGTAALFVLDAGTGELLAMLDTGTAGTENGMSSPIPVDVNGDAKVDFVYAGDLNGNLWKFDLTDSDPANWRSYYGKDALIDGGNGNGIVDGAEAPQPLFTAQGRVREADGSYQAAAATWDQPITTRPAVIRLCERTKAGYLVLFGTGQYLAKADADTTKYMTVYGIWDFGDEATDYHGQLKRTMDGSDPVHELSNLDPGVTLLEQVVDFWGPNPFNTDQQLRVLSDFEPDWTTFTLTEKPKVNAGWFFDLPLSKERVIREIVVRDGKLIFITSIPENDPCAAGGKSIIHEVDACTGGRLATAQFDINNDGKIDQNDLIKLTDASGNDILDAEGNPIWVAPSGVMFDTMLYPPIFLKMGEEEIKHSTGSGGNVFSLKEKSEQTGMFYWRQIDR